MVKNIDSLDVYLDLHPDIEDAAPGKGSIPSEYMFVGACPSPSRPPWRKNEPFGAKSHAVVQKIIEGRSVYITNLVKEPWPASRKLPVRLIRYYYPSLLEEIRIVQPKRILALGAEAAGVLCPGFDELREDHGSIFWNPDVKTHVVPTYHFSAVARQPLLKKFLARDLERFFDLPDPVKPMYKVITQWPSIPYNSDVTMDLEWDTEDNDRITKVGLVCNNASVGYIFRDPTKKQLLELRQELKEQHVTLIGHNFTSDLTRLDRSTGVPWTNTVRDTMVRAHVDGEEFMSLKHLSTFHTDRPGSRAFGGTTDDAYCAEDVYSTREVEGVLRDGRGGDDPFILGVLFELIPWIARMQTSGVYIDRQELKPLLDGQRKQVNKLHKKLLKWGDINWDAPAQVGETLVENGVKLFEKTKKTGQWATGEKILEPIRHLYKPVDDLLNWTEATKYLEFYESWDEKSSDEHPYLHPQLKMLGTRTGRFSMSEPNLQQVPRVGPAKTLFKSRHKGGLIGLMDLSQAELRVVALLANDEQMVEDLLTGDFHATVAQSIYNSKEVSEAQRKKSKGVTFGILYGGTDTGLSYNTGAPVNEVRKIKQGIFTRFIKLAKWIAREEKKGLKSKYSETILGRRRSLLELILAEGEDSARRKIINTPVQATASDIILMILVGALREITKEKMKTRVLFGIHDASIWDIYPGEVDGLYHCLQAGMKKVGQSPLGKLPLYKSLPFVGDLIIGKTWAACEKTNEGYDPMSMMELSTHG